MDVFLDQHKLGQAHDAQSLSLLFVEQGLTRLQLHPKGTTPARPRARPRPLSVARRVIKRGADETRAIRTSHTRHFEIRGQVPCSSDK